MVENERNTEKLLQQIENLQQREQLEHIAKRTEELFKDGSEEQWHFLTGYVYYHNDRFSEAADAFEEANRINSEDEDICWFLQSSRRRAEKERLFQDNFDKMHKGRTSSMQAVKPDEPFSHFDLHSFWEESEYATDNCVSDPFDEEMLAYVEEQLGGYKLPASFLTLMKQQNGGIPIHTCFYLDDNDPSSPEYIEISSIYGIGEVPKYSLCGEFGSRFMIEEWGYPDIGVVICDMPSGGHDAIMLDYRDCGKDGEPAVIHVDQESDYSITYLAPSFEVFVRGLIHSDMFDTSEIEVEETLYRLRNSKFPELLGELCTLATEVNDMETTIRNICTAIVEEKGFLSFHADDKSILMYDLQFWLYTKKYPQVNRDHYLDSYSSIMIFNGSRFSLNGYAPGFIKDWLQAAIESGKIIEAEESNALSMDKNAVSKLLHRLRPFENAI